MKFRGFTLASMFSFPSWRRNEGEFKESVSAGATDYRWANREDLTTELMIFTCKRNAIALCRNSGSYR